MKKWFLSCLLLGSAAMAQPITQAQQQQLQKAEEQLIRTAEVMINDQIDLERFKADSIFTRQLVGALRTPNSFYYPFDSLTSVSHLYAPDSSFRIFTWQLVKDFASVRHKGAIQMRTQDGSLKLIPLFDVSDYTKRPTDSVRDAKNWIGCIYYRIVQKTTANRNFYTLLGFDDNSDVTSKKWIEVLTFDTTGNPHFGGRYFQYENDNLKPKQPAYRFCIEYKKDGRARVNYDPELDVIMFDHLISESKEPEKKATLVPDGDYEGFRWVGGRWLHIDKLFDFKLEDGQAPVPQPLRAENGRLLEDQPQPAEQPAPKKKKKKE